VSEIIVFDVETTGISSKTDQIIEICIQFGLEKDSAVKTWRIKPDTPISPMAQKIHGISMDDLRDCPKFVELADEFLEIFNSVNAVVGYNVEFDIGFIQEEFVRCGKPQLSLKEKSIIDPYRIWAKQEPRNLTAACKRFTGRQLENAHSAQADVQATASVLLGMQEEFKLQDSSLEELASLSGLSRDSWIGPSKHFVLKNEKIVFGFGKNKERSLLEVAGENGGSYLDWILQKDFPDHVKTIIQEAPRSSDEELTKWAKQRFA